MRILTCLTELHDPVDILLALLVCYCGSYVATILWMRAYRSTKAERFNWLFLAGLTAGVAVWATHFIALLGYRPPARVAFESSLTMISVVVGFVAMMFAMALTTLLPKRWAIWVGGSSLGLAIGAMHYVGILAYQIDGVMVWHLNYAVLSVVVSSAFGVLAVRLMCIAHLRHRRRAMAAALSGAVASLHFIGMAALEVIPSELSVTQFDAEAFETLGLGVALAVMMLISMAVSIHVLQDRTMAKSADNMRHIAMHDTLTGIPNRRHFNDVLDFRCAMAEDGDTDFALMIFDLDGFKPVNDIYGHQYGDEVLKRSAQRIMRAVGEDIFVARIGGDEFAVLCDHDDFDLKALTEMCERITELLARPFLIGGNQIEIGASIGVATSRMRDFPLGEMTQNADVALYAAKAAGRGTFRFFDPAMAESNRSKRALEVDLRRAVVREEFQLVYQPQIDAQTGRYVGAEALIRWPHRQRGPVSPDVFIPVAEELGLISVIGTWVLRQACQEARHWPKHLRVAVNLSPVQLRNRRLVETIREILSDTGIDPARIELEITETALVNNDAQALLLLTQIREMGISVALDDFGTGYSSLSYLHRFPFNRIKIDRSFIQSAQTDLNSSTILQAMVQLGLNLGIKVTAEGIETGQQRELAKRQGCDHLQGFLIGRPVPHEELKNLFIAQAASSSAA